MPFPRASQALSRFTVLESDPGPLRADLRAAAGGRGANVIKITALMEDAGGEQPGGLRRGSDFQNLHHNKRTMTLNLKGLEVSLNLRTSHRAK